MKRPTKTGAKAADELRPEYRFDYRTARGNRFAGLRREAILMRLDSDVAKVFSTPESVNHALRALMSALPTKPRRKSGSGKVT
jgi:hypothetical protein